MCDGARGLNAAEINMPVPEDEHHPRSREVRALMFRRKILPREKRIMRCFIAEPLS